MSICEYLLICCLYDINIRLTKNINRDIKHIRIRMYIELL